MDRLWSMDALALARGYREGLFTPMEALDSILERASEVEPVINAFLHLDAVQARGAAERSWARLRQNQALGPLDGIPVSVKDNLHVAGMPTTWGSRLMQGHIAAEDEAPVARLRDAGAVIFGKTSLPEFAMHGYTVNLIKGVTVNPFDPCLTPGGSSGGAAAAVAAGVGPIALATDGGGSIRRPASYCGLVGLKPSRGAVRRSGGLPDLFLDYEVAGPLARSPEDALCLFEALAGGKAEAGTAFERPLRILYAPRFGGNPVDPAIASAVEGVAGRLADMGHGIENTDRFDLADEINELWPSLSAAGLSWLFSPEGRWPELAGRQIDQTLCTANTHGVLASARAMEPWRLYRLLRAIKHAETELSRLFEAYDLILTPATAALAWPADQSHPAMIDGQAVGPRGHAPFSAIANATGLAAISIPADSSRRIGFQLLARAGGDRLLLDVARQYRKRWLDAFRFPDIGL